MRVENVKNAVWICDDEEYYKRRAPRGVGSHASPSSNQSIGQLSTLTPHTPSFIDQVTGISTLINEKDPTTHF